MSVGERLRRRRPGIVGRTVGRHELDRSSFPAHQCYSGSAVRGTLVWICNRVLGCRRRQRAHRGLERQTRGNSTNSCNDGIDFNAVSCASASSCVALTDLESTPHPASYRLGRLEVEPPGQVLGSCTTQIGFVRCATDLRHRRFCTRSKRAFCHARRALPVTNHRSEPTSGRHTFLGASKIDPTASVAPRRRRPPISHHRNGTSNHRAHRGRLRGSLRHLSR